MQLKSLFLNKNLTLSEETYKHNLHLLDKNNRYNLMAYLLADSNCFSIKVARFQGKDKTTLIKKNEYGYKCLLLSMKQVLDYVEALNDTDVVIDKAQRKERKLFDFLCFREAWLNACLHNSWGKMTPPAVYFFEDRIEIISTGGLPADYSLDDFYSGRSRPVNLELQMIMRQIDFIEQTGHGIPLIVSKYGKEVFDITDNFIVVTIPFEHKLVTTKTTESFNPIKISKTQEKIFDLIRKNPIITTYELMNDTGLSEATISQNISQLKELNFIERIGSKRKGYWKVSTQ